jgi:riboflavin-specific deaminase-like protein
MPERLADDAFEAAHWQRILDGRSRDDALDLATEPVYGPLVAAGRGSRLVIGQFGQSLDGRIATPSGESKYLNGSGGLQHLHRLRALVDAVIVGVSTVVADDPKLTVRMVDGASPARVVIDPHGRVDADALMFADDGVRRIVVTSAGTKRRFGVGVEVIRIPEVGGRLPPRAIIEALAAAGLHQVLIEGGADTVSRFLQAGQLDRLHVSVAPVLIGGGRSGVSLSNVQGLADCLRPRIDVHRIGEDVLFDCAFQPL